MAMKPGALRLNRKQLIELIEAIEAEGGDASTLQRELEAMGPPASQAKTGGLKVEKEELTTEERLNAEMGHLFPDGIVGDVLVRIIDIDRNHSLAELRTMCREAGLSTNGHKKQLAARLVIRGDNMEQTTDVVDWRKPMEWSGKPGELRVPEAYITELNFEIVVFTRKERGGSDFTFRCNEYERMSDGQWRFERVIIDTSRRNSQGQVEEARLTYHPEIVLVNTPFMVVPAPKEGF